MPAKVLVVEHSPTDRAAVRQALLELGMPSAGIGCASTLRQARDVMSSGTADCILLGLTLPDAVGLEALAVLRAAGPDTPIVVVTGRAPSDSLVLAALAEGAEECVLKSAIDADLGPAISRSVERRRRTTLLRRSERVAGQALEGIDQPAAALDGSGQIIETNEAWVAVARAGAASPLATGVGVNYLAVCDMAAGRFAAGALEAASGIRAVLCGDLDLFTMDYPCPSDTEDRWSSLRVTALGERGGGAIVSHLDISQLKRAEVSIQGDQAGVRLLPRRRVGHLRRRRRRRRPRPPLGHHPPAAGPRGGRADRRRCLRPDRPCRRRADGGPRGEGPGGSGEQRAPRSLGHRREGELAPARPDRDQPAAGPQRRRPHLHGIGRHRRPSRPDHPATRVARVLRGLPASVIVTDHRGIVVYWNERAVAMFGHSAAYAVGRPLAELRIGPPDEADARRILDAVMADGHWEGDFDARRADGSMLPVYSTLERIDEDDIDFHGLVGASLDISDRRQLEADLAFQALHDPLTSLANRRLFIDHLDGALARSARHGGHTAVLFLDIDDFKVINDSIGHTAGDEVLRTAAGLMSAVARDGDMIARLGGDEFVICSDDVRDLSEACAVADRMLGALAVPFRVEGHEMTVTASVGVALSTPTTSGDNLLRNADAAMYAAKQAGKGRIEVFDDTHHKQARERRAAALDLERGIAAGELVTWFQPQIDLATGALCGFEALVRWRHPVRGLVMPDEFITGAEDAGLIGRVGETVLAEACRALALWRELGPALGLVVSVNVSVRQLGDTGLAAAMRATIEDAGLDPACICLEVTESALMDAPAAVQALRALRAIGVSIAIDDFGTGYSSLSRLKRFPVDFLKIDRTFVSGLGVDPEDDVIVSAVVNLARSLGLGLVAEGIENDQQLELLTDLGCELGQGYLWSPAVPLEEASRLVQGGALHHRSRSPRTGQGPTGRT